MPSCRVLRYEVAVLRRQAPKPKMDWAGRAVLAGFGHTLGDLPGDAMLTGVCDKDRHLGHLFAPALS